MKKKYSWWVILLWILGVLLISVNVAILVTGNSYIYKALVFNYVNIDDLDLFPTRAITNGTPQPWKISDAYNKGKLPDSVRAELEKLQSVAYLVIKDDAICYEEYWDHYSEKSLSNSFSMAKSVIGLLIGIAHDEGKIKSLDEPIGNYLADYKSGPAAETTIRDVLMMSSGSNWDESYSSLFSITTKAYYGSDLEKLLHDEVQIVDRPGRTWSYKSGDTQLLSFILEKATGMHVAEYASEKLWIPTGAELPAQWSLDHKDGHEKAYCCIYSNARDFARIGKLMLDSGSWNGRQLISKEYVRQALAPNDLLYDDDSTSHVTTYGYQWWLMKYKEHPVFYMRGLLGQYVFVIPDQRLIVVRLGKEREKVQVNRNQLEIDYILQGALAVCN
jgi:CubicO group peptidase (beta-lactamase class C family)